MKIAWHLFCKNPTSEYRKSDNRQPKSAKCENPLRKMRKAPGLSLIKIDDVLLWTEITLYCCMCTIVLLNVWRCVLSGGVTGLYVRMCVSFTRIFQSTRERILKYVDITQLAMRRVCCRILTNRYIKFCGKRKMNGFFEFGGLALPVCEAFLFGFFCNQGGHTLR